MPIKNKEMPLNEVIATHVMGWKRDEASKNWIMNKVGEGTVSGQLPDFENNLGDAQMIVKELLRREIPGAGSLLHEKDPRTICDKALKWTK